MVQGRRLSAAYVDPARRSALLPLLFELMGMGVARAVSCRAMGTVLGSAARGGRACCTSARV